METKYSIKNFRVFDSTGADFTFAPITILTGCNSSGKSSVVKSLFLLNSFMAEIKKAIERKEEINLKDYKLDFSQYPNNSLGRFDKVLNRNTEDRCITFEYTIYSNMLSDEVRIQLVFGADEHDLLNNGYLQAVYMFKDETLLFSSVKGRGNSYNFNGIRNDFFDYVLGEYLVHNYVSLSGAYQINGSVSEEEFNEQSKLIFSGLREIGKERVLDITQNIRLTKLGDTILKEVNCEPAMIEWCKQNNSLFNIPIIERLKECTKANIEQSIQALVSIDPKGYLKIALDKIVAEFVGADFETFGDYFKDKENDWLSNISFKNLVNRSMSFLLTKTGLHMPCFNDFYLWNAIIMFLDSKPSRTLDLINGVFTSTEEDLQKEEKTKLEDFLNTPVTFDLIYEVLILLDRTYDNGDKPYVQEENYMYGYSYYHQVYKAVAHFYSRLITEVLTPSWCDCLSYVSSSRMSVKRLYSLDVDDDFTNSLKSYFEAKRLFGESYHWDEYQADSFMNKWVKLFGVGESISLSIDKEGLGVQIRLQKGNGKGALLADEGYGITQLCSILLQIETAIMSRKKMYKTYYVGLDKIDGIKSDESIRLAQTIAIEEPEIHLHPRFQSMLADMFNEAYTKYGIHFIVETHSEYLIRKEQVLVADRKSENHIENDKISIMYVDHVPGISCPVVKNIGVCKNGYLDDTFGSGFFDEASSLSMELL